MKRIHSSIVFILVVLMLFSGVSLQMNTVNAAETRAQMELKNPTLSEALSQSQQYMYKSVKNPGFGNEWFIFSLARGGSSVPPVYYETYYQNLVKMVHAKKGELHNRKYTEYSRVILTLSAIGKDARNVGGYNLVEKLYDFDNVKWQGINGVIFALIALDTGNYTIPAESDKVTNSRQKMIDYIINHQLDDGGLALSGSKGDPDITGMALQALSSYTNQPTVQDTVNKALAYLSTVQNKEAGYLSWGTENVESASQVLVALTSLDIDPKTDLRFIKGDGKWIVSNILSYYSKNDGAFKHILNEDSNSMATEQASYALASYNRFLKKQPKLYDMQDVKPVETLIVNGTSDGSTSITGMVDPGEKVTAKANNKLIGSATANSIGSFSIKIAKQKAGTKVQVLVSDYSGKEISKIITIEDKTPPTITINPVSDQSTTVTGKTEAKATVKLYTSGKLRQTKTADGNGKYVFTISKQKAGVKIQVTGSDKAGNTKSIHAVVSDKTPPKQPTVNKVTIASTLVSGKTEANVTVYVYKGKTKLGSAKADRNGNYKVKISKQKVGTKLSVYAQDQAKNKSKSTVVTVLKK